MKFNLLKNFYFSKKKYRNETTNVIFSQFFDKKNEFENIMDNINERRKLPYLIYKKKIKSLT